MSDTHLDYSGLRTSIAIEGKHVAQYDAQFDEAALQATSWIVSEPDKFFSMNIELMNREHGQAYSVAAYLDGHKACKFLHRPERPSLTTLDCTRISPTQTRKFMFGRIELTDDDALLGGSSAHAIGEIKVIVSKVGGFSQVPYLGHINAAPEEQKMHERAKKGLVHSVKYGEAEENPSRQRTYRSTNEVVVATHIIKYRPLAWLQANGIVPYTPANPPQNTSKSPSPVPGPSSTRNSKKRKAPEEADVKPIIPPTNNNQDADEGEDLDKEENELWEKLVQVRQKKAQRQKDGQQAKRVKTEDRKPIISGDVIDLTI